MRADTRDVRRALYAVQRDVTCASNLPVYQRRAVMARCVCVYIHTENRTALVQRAKSSLKSSDVYAYTYIGYFRLHLNLYIKPERVDVVYCAR